MIAIITTSTRLYLIFPGCLLSLNSSKYFFIIDQLLLVNYNIFLLIFHAVALTGRALKSILAGEPPVPCPLRSFTLALFCSFLSHCRRSWCIRSTLQKLSFTDADLLSAAALTKVCVEQEANRERQLAAREINF